MITRISVSIRAWGWFVLAVLFITPRLYAASAPVTAAEYLAAQPKPHFKPGHTLPPLTRFGWTLPFDARVELADNWGYGLEFGGYATLGRVTKDLDNPASEASRLVALAASDPKRYRLAVICARDLPTDVPPETWTRNATGRLLDGKAQSLDGNVWHKGMKTVYSPAAPDQVWREAGRLRADPLRRIREKCPIAIVLNGGEYGIGVLGFAQKVWEQDPAILKDKGGRPWFDYVSERKAHAEKIIAEAVRAAAPDRQLYVYYTAGGGTHRELIGNWREWEYGWEWMQGVGDLPSNECYYRSFNDGWTGSRDMLTLALGSAAREIASGKPLSYNWLCAGWTRDKLNDGGLGDLTRYTGFLKCYYTAGMIGGNAGYYAYPAGGGFAAKLDPAVPPHWLRQMMALAHVHALFSHLEPFLRQGELLPGPVRHRFAKDLPAYEFPTGDPDARVLVRKLKDQPRWLVTAWAAGGIDREVKVEVPGLGKVELRARACGSVYLARLAGGGPVLTLIDANGLDPTEHLPPLEADSSASGALNKLTAASSGRSVHNR